MANTKYEFTGDTKESFGKTLKRIRALASFGITAKGEIGGWIEIEGNLSTEGNAWVAGDARIAGNAWVEGNARVEGDADFFLLGPIGSRRDFLTIHADAELGVRFSTGCFSGTEFQLKEAIQKTHGDNEYARQYRAAIELALMIVRAKEKETAIEKSLP